MNKTILTVEDDRGLQKYLRDLLAENNYSVLCARTGITALNVLKKVEPDLVLLDLALPDIQGESICLEIRKNHPNIPVIILTAKDSVTDIIQGLNLGADDYVTKPFVAEVLLARIKTRLRRYGEGESVLKVANLELDTQTLDVKRNSKKIQLTPQEFKLLEYLMLNKGRVLTREMILGKIWAYSPDAETRVVDVYVGYLRKKIDEGFRQKLIYSIRGFGYTIKEDADLQRQTVRPEP